MPSLAKDKDSPSDKEVAAAIVVDEWEAKREEAKKKPQPPCPPKPKEVPEAPPGWRVIRHKKPKCCLDNRLEWVWTFFYYVNMKTHKTQHFPPVDFEEEEKEEGGTTIDLTRPKSRRSFLDHFVKPPTEDALAREENGEEEPEPMELDNEGGDEDVPFHELPPSKQVFTALHPVKLYKNPRATQVDAKGKLLSFPARCSEALGMDEEEAKKLTMQQLGELLKSHFIMNVFDGDVNAYHQADCFQAGRQSIDRKRKPTKAAKVKAKTVKKAGGRKKEQVIVQKRTHHKGMSQKVICFCCC